MTGYIGTIGTLAGGFQYDDGMTISGTANGRTAEIRYTGPYENYQLFLNSIFGLWTVTQPTADPGTGQVLPPCTAALTQSPCPLPTHWVSGVPPSVIVDPRQFLLYPDTYRMAITGDPTEFLQAAESPTSAACDFYPFTACSAVITVTYRHKTIAGFPFPYQKVTLTPSGPTVPNCLCNSPANWETSGFGDVIPNVSPGTFIEILETAPRVEFMTTPSKDFKFVDPPTATIGRTGISGGPGCGKKTNGSTTPIGGRQVPEIVDDFIPINSDELIVRWSNLPFIPDGLRELTGTVNEIQFLDFPPGGVFFAGYTPLFKGDGLKVEQRVDLDMTFNIKTVDTDTSTVSSDPNDANRKEVESIFEIVCNRMGAWNRRWSSCPDGYDESVSFVAANATFWTNWLNIVRKDEKVIGVPNFLPPVRTANWKDMFTI